MLRMAHACTWVECVRGYRVNEGVRWTDEIGGVDARASGAEVANVVDAVGFEQNAEFRHFHAEVVEAGVVGYGSKVCPKRINGLQSTAAL